MAEIALTGDASKKTASLSEKSDSENSLMPRYLNSKGEVCLILPPELEKSFQAKERGRLLEAQRLKERLSQHPLHTKRAAERGEKYWNDLASSYQGTE